MREIAKHHAHVAELADAYGSGPYGETRGGSSPLVSIFMNSTADSPFHAAAKRQIENGEKPSKETKLSLL